MEKLKMRSPNLVEENIDRIAELFPNCITEDRDEKGNLRRTVDFDLLRQELSPHLVEGVQERYTLNWPGKNEAILAANSPIAKTIRPCEEESVDFERTKNAFIEGDNLDALKLLQETYLGKIKMIYIDPPYNTGKDFLYNDDFAEDSEEFLIRSNQKDDVGNRLVSNTDSNGRFHSDWLSMIYPRLKLARNLLAEDGAIFISIDDHEINGLRYICDDIFGRNNFIATIIWQKVFSPKNSAKHLSEDHDYVILYAKNSEIWRPNLLPRSQEMEDRYSNPDNDPRGPWTSSDLCARNYYGEGTYSVVCPSGRVINGPPTGTYWRVSKGKFKQLDNESRIWWGKDGNNMPRLKRFLSSVKAGRVPQTIWFYKDVGHTQEAKKELLKHLKFSSSDSVFHTPKPTRLIKQMLRLATTNNSPDIVMDFFSGTATTGEAVVGLNDEDGGNRRYILVQLPEATGSKDYTTIAEIGKERLRSTSKTNRENDSQDMHFVDTGFRVFKIDSSNMKDIYYIPDELQQGNLELFAAHIKEDRRPEDLLFQVFLDWGLDLALPIEKEVIEGKTVFFVDENALSACFDNGIKEDMIKILAKRRPLRAVFRDDGFDSDSTKINAEQIFKSLSPETEVKTI